jgi:hypothetical protein
MNVADIDSRCLHCGVRFFPAVICPGCGENPMRRSFWFKVTGGSGRLFYVEALERESLTSAYQQMRRYYPGHNVFAAPEKEAREWIAASPIRARWYRRAARGKESARPVS